jgi:phosphoglycerate dehydrogenase-like enzyme
MTHRIALLDDYQNIALRMADWSRLADCEVVALSRHIEDPDELARVLADFDIVMALRERTPLRAGLLARLPRLKLIVTAGKRNASIDMAAAHAQGIVVCGTSGLTYPTAELAIGLMLSLARDIPNQQQSLREGRWQTRVGVGLNGKTLGVLGLGTLGSRVARIGRALEMDVIAWSQNLTAERAAEHGARRVEKDELFARSDFLSIHLVLSERTRGLVGARELASMKRTAYLVNTSRGPIVDEAALLSALRGNKIAGAGVDVYDVEPLPLDHPLRKLDRAVITPHLGYVTAEGYRRFYTQMAEDIRAWLDGKPIRVIPAPA